VPVFGEKMPDNRKFDFCVCGNGMVGSVITLALAKRGFSVAWVGSEKPKPYSEQDLPDVRVSAISLSSVALLKSVGVWDSISAMRVKPYSKMRVWEEEGVATQFNADQIYQSELGFFVENRLIQLACLEKAKSLNNIYIVDHNVESVLHYAEYASVKLVNNHSIDAHWVIGAEGVQSKVREGAGIGTKAWRYQQQAMGIIVELDEPSPDETWQRFYQTGPRALLPMFDCYAALVWYDSAETLAELAKLNDKALLAQIKEAFPSRLPSVKKIMTKAQFPLNRMHAECYVKHRAILVGDAAHTVNPLAGQGVNMGFLDVKSLISVIDDHITEGIMSTRFRSALNWQMNTVQKQRNRVMMTALEGIYQVFKLQHSPAKTLRNLGLFAADKSKGVKAQMIKFAAGLS
jgi:2-octaprenyl-3-methyl-6-methoxy-1,4-benzoquinol hydroxylase